MSVFRKASSCHHCRNLCPLKRGCVNRWDFVVALAGTPNTGKSTVFNQLTGLRQHTGNWPGKTVTRAEGRFSFEKKQYKLVDLPGTYSLLSSTAEEQIARDFILFEKPDITIVVTDATCLERNISLVLQVLQITNRVIMVLNLMDEAKANHLSINVPGLARDIGVPVVPMVARRGEGVEELLVQVSEVACGKRAQSRPLIPWSIPSLRRAMEELSLSLKERFPGSCSDWIALRLLEGDPHIIEAIATETLGM